MFAIIACALFITVFIFIGAAVSVSTSWLSIPALLVAGIACISIDYTKRHYWHR